MATGRPVTGLARLEAASKAVFPHSLEETRFKLRSERACSADVMWSARRLERKLLLDAFCESCLHVCSTSETMIGFWARLLTEAGLPGAYGSRIRPIPVLDC